VSQGLPYARGVPFQELRPGGDDEAMDVFDSHDGAWHRQTYTPPRTSRIRRRPRRDDYAALVLPKTTALTRQIVYSHPMHAFNGIDGTAGIVPMDGGYVAVTYDPVSVVLLGTVP